MVVTESRLRQAAFIAALLFFFLFFYQTPFQTGDSIWSNVIGQWIVTHHHIPTHDHWAWTAVGQPWTPQEWGFEVLLYLTNHVLGFLGVVLMMTLISVLTWVVLADLLKRQGRAYPRLWALLAAAVSCPWDQIRAETFSYLFFVLTLWVLELSKERPRRLFWLIPLELVWVNLHGSYPLGIGVVFWMALVSFLRSFDWGWLQHTQEKRVGRQRLWTALGMAVVSLVNPQGIHMYTFAFWLSFQTHISKYIMEWQPATIAEWPTLVLFVELGLFLFLRLQRKEPVRLSELFWALGTFYMFLKAVRFGSYAIVTTPWALATNIPFQHHWLERLKQVKGLASVISLGVAVGCLALSVQTGLNVHGTMAQNAAPNVEPKVVQVVLNIHKAHPDWRMWNGYGVGDALESAGLPVSIDGRTEVYLANGFMNTYMKTVDGKTGTLKWFEQKHIRLACVDKTAPLSELLTVAPGWTRIYNGKHYDLFEKKVGVPA